MLILSDGHHTVTSSLSNFFCVCERYAEDSGVGNGAKLSGWMVDSQKVGKIDY